MGGSRGADSARLLGHGVCLVIILCGNLYSVLFALLCECHTSQLSNK